MKRKLLNVFLVACVMSQLFVPSIHAEENDFFNNSIILLVDSPMCFVDGELKSVGDVAPTIVNDRTLVPVRFLTESLGGTAKWDDNTATATLECEGNTIDVPIGKNKIVVNGDEHTLDVGAELISDRTMLPLRAIGEALGKSVNYDAGIISLSDNDVENYDKNSPYSQQTMTAVRKKLSLEKNGKKVVSPTVFTFGEMMANAGSLIFSEKDVPYASKADSYVVTGNIYIENLKINEYNDTEYKMSFDAYNYDYVYGIAEVYDADGNMLQYQVIKPFGGTWTSLVEYGVAVYNMGVGISDWVATGNSAYFTYRNQTQTEHTSVELIVPKDGYVHITANPANSRTLCVYDVTKIISQSISVAASSVASLKDDEVVKLFVDEVEKNIASSLESAFTDDAEFYSELIALISGEVDAMNSGDSAKSLAKKVFNLLEDKGIKLLDDAEKIAGEIFVSTGEGAVKELASLLVDGGIGKALDAMSLINSASDYVCFMMDIHFSTAKTSLILEMITDELKVYCGDAKFKTRTVSGTANGFILENNEGETEILHRGNFEYRNFITDGRRIYYYNKDTLAINCIDIDKHTNVKLSDVFGYFNTYYTGDWDREDCFSCGNIAGYYDGKIYFEECGSFELFPLSTVDIKTGSYQLTPLKNVGTLGFYGDKMYYMIQTGSFDMWPMYVADLNGNNSTVFKSNIWKFEVRDNMMYYCIGISDSYEDYNKGNLYRLNLDTGEEELLVQNIKPGSEFEGIVAQQHLSVK